MGLLLERFRKVIALIKGIESDLVMIQSRGNVPTYFRKLILCLLLRKS